MEQDKIKIICNNPNISTHKRFGEDSFNNSYTDTSCSYAGTEMSTIKSIFERIKESYVLQNN